MTSTERWPADTDPSVRYPLYTRGNVGEVLPNVMSVITGTLIGDQVNRASFSLFEEMGFLLERDLEPVPSATGVFGGYLYANASLFRLIGARTPGMTVDDAEEQVSGGSPDMPPYVARRGDKSVVASLKLGLYMSRILRRPDLTPLDGARSSARAWLASLPPLATASDAEILAFVESYPPRLQASMNALLRYGMLSGGARALLDRLLERSGAPAGLANRLLSGIDDIDSAQLARRQWELGRIVAEDPGLTARFDEGLVGLVDDLTGTALDAPLCRFLADWGHRCKDEYELASPSWSMDPAPVLAAVDRLRQVPPHRSPEAATAQLRADREAIEHGLDRFVPRPLRRLVRRSIGAARAGAIGRERAKDILVLENLGVRLALHELYRRAADRGAPSDVDACACVAAGELAEFVHDPLPFLPIIAERRRLRRFLSDREPPAWFEGQIPDPASWPMRDPTGRPAPPPGSRLTGIAVSAGTTSGHARVIHDPSDPRGLEPGEVLVCPITDPSWTPLFLVASAVVSDTGAMQSHAAIVARELGIPGVMSVRGATSIEDGTWLEVDGDTGTVTVGERQR